MQQLRLFRDPARKGECLQMRAYQVRADIAATASLCQTPFAPSPRGTHINMLAGHFRRCSKIRNTITVFEENLKN